MPDSSTLNSHGLMRVRKYMTGKGPFKNVCFYFVILSLDGNGDCASQFFLSSVPVAI